MIDFEGPHRGGHFGDRKTVLRGPNGRSQIIGEFSASEAVGKFLPAVDDARHGDGVYALLGHIAETLLVQEFRCKGFRRPAAGVQSIEFVGFGIVDDDEQIAADAVHHRGDHAHHGVGGDGGIDSVAAVFEDLHPGLRGQRGFGGYDAVGGNNHRARLSAVLRADNRHSKKARQEQQR